MIIGSNKAKNMIIQQGITPRLIQLLDDPIGSDDLKLEGTPHLLFQILLLFLILKIFVYGRCSDSGDWIPSKGRWEPY